MTWSSSASIFPNPILEGLVMVKTIAVVTAGVLSLGGCATRSGGGESVEEMARERLAQLPQETERVVAPMTHQGKRDTLDFVVYTWIPTTDSSGAQLIQLLGENLGGARSLEIGELRVPLMPAADGLSAAGPYPFDAPQDHPIVVTVGSHRVELAERFSGLKLEGLPRILGCEYQWEDVMVPERVPEVGGQSVRALRFECAVDRVELRNAPVTAFFGSLAVPNDQITEYDQSVTGYVYRTERLRNDLPAMIDFGDGLRVLAPSRLKLP